MPNPTLTVTTPVYEGPLDLLLELIEKRKLLINDISLAQVTDEYIARVNSMGELPIADTAEFVALAATLLLIKSRSLLPTLTVSEDESRDIKELEYRLAVYQLLKEAAKELAAARPALWAGERPERESIFLFDESITEGALVSAGQALISGFPKSLTLPKVAVRKIASLEETIEQLATRVSSAFSVSFKEFSGLGKAATAEAKHGVIVSFLALLELVKQGILQARQDSHFSDITLESDAVTTPRYE